MNDIHNNYIANSLIWMICIRNSYYIFKFNKLHMIVEDCGCVNISCTAWLTSLYACSVVKCMYIVKMKPSNMFKSSSNFVLLSHTTWFEQQIYIIFNINIIAYRPKWHVCTTLNKLWVGPGSVFLLKLHWSIQDLKKKFNIIMFNVTRFIHVKLQLNMITDFRRLFF